MECLISYGSCPLYLKQLLLYFETGDNVLMVENLWLLGCSLEVKPNKKDRLVRRVTLKTESAVLERPIDKIVLLEAP